MGLLSNTDTLFSSLTEDEVRKIIREERFYKKGSVIIRAQESNTSVMFVKSGLLKITRISADGNENTVSLAESGDVFAEAFSILERESPVEISAIKDSSVVFLDTAEIEKNIKAVNNLLKILAERNLYLTKRIEHLMEKSIKDKVLSLLKEESERQGCRTIRLSYNREEMARYLSTDRSALSAVLSRMKKEGIINYRKNEFTLLET